MLFLNWGLNFGCTFQLSTEWDEAGVFDDVVFQYDDTTQGPLVRFLQAKHKQDESKKIKRVDLLNETDGDFSLLKYFISFRKIRSKSNEHFNNKIRSNDHFNNAEIQDLLIATNIDLHASLERSFKKIEKPDKLLEILGKTCYKFRDGGSLTKENISEILKKSSDLHLLAQKLGECIMEGKKITLQQEIFKRYSYPLSQSVIDCDNAKFHANFVGNVDNIVDKKDKALRILLEKEFVKKKKPSTPLKI